MPREHNALDTEPSIASFMKSMLFGGGPVNSVVWRDEFMSEERPTECGIVPVEALRPVAPGWTASELCERIGSPLEIRSQNSTAGPTELFQSFGFSIFDFEVDRDLDEVWIYKHDRRGKFLLTRPLFSFVGVRNGIVTGIWQRQA